MTHRKNCDHCAYSRLNEETKLYERTAHKKCRKCIRNEYAVLNDNFKLKKVGRIFKKVNE